MLAFSNKYTKLLTILLSFLLLACSSVPKLESAAIAPKVTLPANHQTLGVMSAYADPWEGFNRRMYYFNAKADE